MRVFRNRPADRFSLSGVGLRRTLLLTRLGMAVESLWRSFWPLVTVALAAAAVVMLGLLESAPLEIVPVAVVLTALAVVALAIRGAMRLRWPSRAAALHRLDIGLLDRPIQALLDRQAVNQGDPVTEAAWVVHRERMVARAATARPVAPDLRVAAHDPYALRYAAALAFAIALVFGSFWRQDGVDSVMPGSVMAGIHTAWEGWLEPPRYTRRPTLYLADIMSDEMEAPVGSRVILRFYGEPGTVKSAESVSGRAGDLPSASDPAQEFNVVMDGRLRIDGPGGHAWDVRVIPDRPPSIAVAGEAEAEVSGPMTLPFEASDDYGITGGLVRIELDLPAVGRSFGLLREPDSLNAITARLPLPVAGDRSDFVATFREDYSRHPWVHLPVVYTFHGEDAAGQTSFSEPYRSKLPGRRFFDPVAAAIIEQRRDLLWAKANAPRVAKILRAISHRPEDLFRSETAYLRLRAILRRLEIQMRYDLTESQRDGIAEAMWDLAIRLEEGDIADALERLRAAEERLLEAMKNGATEQEINKLMQELQRATEDYLRQLARQARENAAEDDERIQPDSDSIQMTRNDLQRMMDRIRELMEQNRFAEAREALEQFRRMMENLRIAQGPGQGGTSPGQRAMDGLAETLREQQGLSDEAFRELQEQFNRNSQSGQNSQNEGFSGGQGRGQSHDGQGQVPGGTQGAEMGGSLADRQGALRRELRRQRNQLPGMGMSEGDSARGALGRAGRAMENAEDSLRGQDYAQALDDQSRAMEALRDGMRALGEEMARQEGQSSGEGSQFGSARNANRDPLGRRPGFGGRLGTEKNLLQGEDVYRRAGEILDEIRRRSGEGARPAEELDYLRRLLERFRAN